MVNSIKSIYSSPLYNFDAQEMSPTEYIESKRYIQRHVSEKMFGQFDWSNTPYMKQITEHLSPYDPVTHVALMKGVRIGGTFSLVHNGVPYVMSERPTNIMLLSANDSLATKTMEGVDNGIDGCNIRHLIGKGSGVQSNSKGDTQQQKFFSGGFKLFNYGGQSASNMRQVTAGLVIADELDAFKGISKEAGNFLKLMEDRARSLGDSKKIIYISSPLLQDSSLIYELYLRGNQNVYYVPCPNCGEYIELVWNERNENNTRYGVLFDVKDGEVVKKSVRYMCGKCENEFAEKKHKHELLNCGVWKPSIEREDKNFVSYRISALYAPATMDNWYDFAKEYQQAYPRTGIKDNAKMQSFKNSIEGLPFKPEGQTLKSTKLQQNRRDYKIGECPFELSKKDNNGEIMIISVQCDLNGYEHDGRIDYSVIAHSERGATYSIDAGSFGTFIPKVERQALEKEGVNVAKLEKERIKYTYQFGLDNTIWTGFEEVVKQKFGKFNRPITILAVDVGHMDNYALEFVEKMKRHGVYCIGVKGEKEETFQDQAKTEYGKIYKTASTGDYFLLNVNVIKDRLASYIDSNSYVDDSGQLRQDPSFMNFPEYDSKVNKYTYRNFFAHYEAEHKLKKTSEGGNTKYLWEKKRTMIQNHFLDVEVYGIFCKILMIDEICGNNNPYKALYYKSQKIEPNWKNACSLIKEASFENNLPLS
ncbi:MAG: phage terminase large subunit family protein [Aureibaculum sp.]|nr:phage terminase large subunit family protein [Aureibaculum sp.]